MMLKRGAGSFTFQMSLKRSHGRVAAKAIVHVPLLQLFGKKTSLTVLEENAKSQIPKKGRLVRSFSH